MKELICFLATLILLLVACGGDSDDANSVSADPTQADVVAEEAPTEAAATATPLRAPTAAPEPTQAAALITSADEMAGIWLVKVAGESGYVMYTADGRYLVALSQDALATAPRVSGEYWFDDNQIHLRDLENAGHWAECDSETVGVYDVVDLGDGQMEFQMVDDGCGDSGFTRSYVFANMQQEWVAEPVEVVAPE
jgi:hypothetical protein